MSGTIHRFPDRGDAPRTPRAEPATVVILPVVRVEPSKRRSLQEMIGGDKDPVTGAWQFTVSVNAPLDAGAEHSCEILSFDPTDEIEAATRLRQYADALESVSRVMRMNAHKIAPDPRGPQLATFSIYTAGDHQAWTRKALDDLGQPAALWLRAKLEGISDEYAAKLAAPGEPAPVAPA